MKTDKKVENYVITNPATKKGKLVLKDLSLSVCCSIDGCETWIDAGKVICDDCWAEGWEWEVCQ